MSQKNILKIRSTIDTIDKQIIKLLGLRKKQVLKIAKYKNKRTIVDKKRINQIMKRIKAEAKKNKIDSIIEDAKNDDYETAVKRIDSFKEKLKNYRTAGLEKGGEFSYENLTFKFLRRNGYIDKIFNFRDKLMDKELSVENKVDE